MAIISRFEISKITHNNNYVMHSAHTHSYYEMFYLTEGNCDLFIKDNMYSITSGSIAFIPSNVLHRTCYKDSFFNERVNVEFTANYINEIINQLGMNWLNGNLFSKIFYLPENERGEINKLLSDIIIEKRSNNSLSTCSIKIKFQLLILTLIKHIENSSIHVVNNETTMMDASIKTAINYINDNFQSEITLNELADLLHLNPSYLSKKFKQCNGLGFKEYLNNVRINHSEKLLLETDKPITEIAFECGYDNSNYYGDAFKKFNGVSPSFFRKSKGIIEGI